ncbi:MAG TPA: YlmC/YmxH family sporulation protein [Clostridiales bacterium]|nr:YlmC/YmxH family sporulation protein [Clostridiales bacterium]
MTKSSDFRQKEVININNGKRLGYVIDMEFNLYEGRITAIVVPGGNKILGFLKGDGDIVIPWEKIKRIGDDVILVDFDTQKD